MPAELDACVRATMVREGISEEKAFAICTAALQKAGKISSEELTKMREHLMKRKKKLPVSSYAELNAVEILQVGALPARGIAFTLTDLEEIAENTPKLMDEEIQKPPGKL